MAGKAVTLCCSWVPFCPSSPLVTPGIKNKSLGLIIEFWCWLRLEKLKSYSSSCTWMCLLFLLVQDEWDKSSIGLFLAAFLSKLALPAQHYFLLHLLLAVFCSLYLILIILKPYSSPTKMKEGSWSGHPWEGCCTLGKSHLRQCWVWGFFFPHPWVPIKGKGKILSLQWDVPLLHHPQRVLFISFAVS